MSYRSEYYNLLENLEATRDTMSISGWDMCALVEKLCAEITELKMQVNELQRGNK
jgi:hypothetical protein